MSGFPSTCPLRAAVENDRPRGPRCPLQRKAKEARLSEAVRPQGGVRGSWGTLGVAQESLGTLCLLVELPGFLAARQGNDLRGDAAERKWLQPRGTHRASARHFIDALRSAFLPDVRTYAQAPAQRPHLEDAS